MDVSPQMRFALVLSEILANYFNLLPTTSQSMMLHKAFI